MVSNLLQTEEIEISSTVGKESERQVLIHPARYPNSINQRETYEDPQENLTTQGCCFQQSNKLGPGEMTVIN